MSSPSTPFPWKGDARRAGGWPKENESEANLHRYATSFQRKEGEAVKTIYSLPVEGGCPKGRALGEGKRAKPTSGATRHLLPEEGGRMPPFLHRHFERKREIFFVRGQAKVVREAGNGKHRMLHVTGDHGASCRWIYEGKQQTANEKDPSAALGMTKRGNASRPFLFNPEQKPISAPKGRRLAA